MFKTAVGSVEEAIETNERKIKKENYDQWFILSRVIRLCTCSVHLFLQSLRDRIQLLWMFQERATSFSVVGGKEEVDPKYIRMLNSLHSEPPYCLIGCY